MEGCGLVNEDILDRLQAIEDRLNYQGYSLPVLNAGEPQMLQVDTIEGLDPATRKFFDVAVKGPPDITYKSLRDVDGNWSWRLLSTGRFPLAEQGRDEGSSFVDDTDHYSDSVSDFKTILSTNLTTPLTKSMFGLMTFSLLIDTVGSAGSASKEIRILINGAEDTGTIQLQSGDGGYFAMFIIGPVAPWGLRSFEGMNATWSGVEFPSTTETIERIEIQARTMDTEEGNDRVYGANLIVYA